MHSFIIILQKSIKITPMLFALLTIPKQADGNTHSSLNSLRRFTQLAISEGWVDSLIRKFRTYPRLDRVYRLVEAGHLQEAKKILENLLHLNAENTQARIAYIELLYNLQDFSSVIQQASTLLKTNPALIIGYFYRGMANQRIGRTENAIADFQAIVGSHLATGDELHYALSSLANLFMQKHQYRKALKILSQFAPSNKNFRYYFIIGIALEALNKFQYAVNAYEAALDSAHNNLEKRNALIRLGEVSKKRKDWEEASDRFKAVLEIEPKNLSSVKSLAEITYVQKNYVEAEKWMRKATNIEPSISNIRYLANIFILQKEYLNAIKEFNKILPNIDSLEDQYQIYMAIGFAYLGMESFKEAAQAFEKAVKIKRNFNTWMALAQAQEKAKHYTAATQALKEALKIQPKPEIYLRLAFLYLKRENPDKALKSLKQATRKESPQDVQERALRQQVHIYINRGLYSEAKRALKRLEEIGQIKTDDSKLFAAIADASVSAKEIDEATRLYERSLSLKYSPRVARRLALVQAEAENFVEAKKIYLDLLNAPNISQEEERSSLKSLGYVYEQLGQNEKAIDAFRGAIELGEDSAEIHQSLGFILEKTGDWQQALQQFLLASKLERTPRSLIHIGRIYHKLGKAGLAIYYLRYALDTEEAEAFTSTERIEILNELGYLYAEVKKHHQAAEAWQHSLRLNNDPEIVVRLGRIQRLLDQNDKAKATLQRVTESNLTNQLIVLRLEELAKIEANEQYWLSAIRFLEKANKIQESAEHFHQLGLYHRHLGNLQKGAVYFKKALSLKPSNNQYAIDLGYTYKALGRKEDAASLFAKVAERQPDNLTIAKELAYTQMQLGNNEKATDWFKKAIDIQSLHAADSVGEQDKMDAEIYYMRNSIQRMNNYLDFDFYQIYRSNSNNIGGVQGTVVGGIVPSQGGFQVSFQPQKFGFLDERVFQAFTRFLWSNKPDSIEIDGKSLQGGVGFRYKPLKSQNLYIGAGRLFKIGDNSINSWLLRATYGWSSGTSWVPNKDYWNYSLVYGDFGYFTKQPGTLAFYGELRQGISFKLGNGFILTPHLIIDGRYQSTNPSDRSYFEGGGGISLKYLFNETRYETYRSRAELFVQYRAGIINAANGWVITGVIGF